jgi:hypothetical protein
VGEVYLS